MNIEYLNWALLTFQYYRNCERRFIVWDCSSCSVFVGLLVAEKFTFNFCYSNHSGPKTVWIRVWDCGIYCLIARMNLSETSYLRHCILLLKISPIFQIFRHLLCVKGIILEIKQKNNNDHSGDWRLRKPYEIARIHRGNFCSLEMFSMNMAYIHHSRMVASTFKWNSK